jgi:hypothetical protein
MDHETINGLGRNFSSLLRINQSPYQEEYRNDTPSSSSQSRLSLLSENKEWMNNLTIMNNYHPNRENTIDKINYSHNIVDRTIKDSIAETRVTLNNLKTDLNKLVLKENAKRNEHDHNRGDLQEAWDKLVQLRTHISLFKSAIEEATLEDASAFLGTKDIWQSSDRSISANGQGVVGRLPLTAEAAIRLGDLNDIREKIRIKEELQKNVMNLEDILSELRQKLDKHSIELSRVNNEPDRLLVSTSIGASMVMRQLVMSLSLQLEEREREYICSKKNLEVVEMELSSLLERARSNENYNLNLKNAPLDETYPHLKSKYNPHSPNPHSNTTLINKLTGQVLDKHNYDDLKIINQMKLNQNDDKLSNLINIKNDDMVLLENIQKEGSDTPFQPTLRCQFSLHEVLSGSARVTRFNGEEAKVYRGRLEKRLTALVILDRQLQEELLLKTEDVRRARDEVRDVEVLRLRVELQVNHVDKSLSQFKIMDPPPDPGPPISPPHQRLTSNNNQPYRFCFMLLIFYCHTYFILYMLVCMEMN